MLVLQPKPAQRLRFLELHSTDNSDQRSFHSPGSNISFTPDFSSFLIFFKAVHFLWRFVKSGFHCTELQTDLLTSEKVVQFYI